MVPHVIGVADEGPQDGWSLDRDLNSGPRMRNRNAALNLHITVCIVRLSAD